VRASDKSIRKIKAARTTLKRRARCPIPLDEIVANVNRSLKGWVNYFHYRNSRRAMAKG
jgi:hypothetical protein